MAECANIAKAVGIKAQTLSSPVPLDPKDLQAWADGTMANSRMSLIKMFSCLARLTSMGELAMTRWP